MDIILASQSPRRSELLSSLGYNFKVIPSDADETIDDTSDIDAELEYLAWKKAEAVFSTHPGDVVIAADTIVWFENQIYGKPHDKAEAAEMLLDLSGRWHDVKTGVCIMTEHFKISFTETTRVHFKGLTDREILDYVNSGKAMDKAGAYGIQETDFADEIDGDYNNVVGLPAQKVSMVLQMLYGLYHPCDPDYFYPDCAQA